jgi:hypothetical protein
MASCKFGNGSATIEAGSTGTYTLTATDKAGNVKTCSKTVTDAPVSKWTKKTDKCGRDAHYDCSWMVAQSIDGQSSCPSDQSCSDGYSDLTNNIKKVGSCTTNYSYYWDDFETLKNVDGCTVGTTQCNYGNLGAEKISKCDCKAGVCTVTNAKCKRKVSSYSYTFQRCSCTRDYYNYGWKAQPDQTNLSTCTPDTSKSCSNASDYNAGNTRIRCNATAWGNCPSGSTKINTKFCYS